MPLSHTRSFRVRHYECDAHGHLNNVNYLRYMQETAFDASAAAGYDLKRYQEMERLWLIRESGIEFIRPLLYNETVGVKTWIADFRRVSSRRLYEFRLLGSGELVANAYTDWVYLDTAANMPARIPNSLAQGFFSEGVPAQFPSRQPFPQPPPAPDGIYKMAHTVSWGDIDNMRHVNNAVYMNYVNECSMQVLEAHNWPWSRMQEHGFGIYLRSACIQYLQPALLGQHLEVATWASDMRRATAHRHYTIRRGADDRLLALAYTMGVWVNLKTGQPVRIPNDFREAFAPNIA